MNIGRSTTVGRRSVRWAKVVGVLALTAGVVAACSSSSSSTGGADQETSTVPLAVTSTRAASSFSSSSESTSPGDSSATSAVPATKSSTSVLTAALPTTVLPTTVLPTTVLPTTVLSSASWTQQPSHLADLTIGVDEVVKFVTGTTSIAVDGAVIRGERDVYRVGAAQGQILELRIASTEDNAVFNLFAPDGTMMATEASASKTLLPIDGDYLIVVGGNRGNATYKLRISIPA